MIEKQSTVTLQNIADRAGVSRMTVSLALRNSPRLAVATRERVQALAKEMGYHGHSLVSALMIQLRSRRSPTHLTTLAFVFNDPSEDAFRRPKGMNRDYLDGGSERADQLGYRIEPIWAKEPGMTGRRLSAILRARGIGGLLVGGVKRAPGHVSLDWSKFAAVTLGYSIWNPRLARASADHYQCMVLALRHAKRLGYKRLGLVMDTDSDKRTESRFQAAMLVYQQRQRREDRVPVLISRLTEPSFNAWLKKHRPDVVLTNGSDILRVLREGGLGVPRDIGFIHLHRDATDDACAGVHHNGREIAAAAVDLVVGQLQRNEFGLPERPRVVLVPGYWVDGPTVRSPLRGVDRAPLN